MQIKLCPSPTRCGDHYCIFLVSFVSIHSLFLLSAHISSLYMHHSSGSISHSLPLSLLFLRVSHCLSFSFPLSPFIPTLYISVSRLFPRTLSLSDLSIGHLSFSLSLFSLSGFTSFTFFPTLFVSVPRLSPLTLSLSL